MVPFIGVPGVIGIVPFIGVPGVLGIVPFIGVPGVLGIVPFIGVPVPGVVRLFIGLPAGGVIPLFIGVPAGGVVPLFIGVPEFGGVPLSIGIPVPGVPTGGAGVLLSLICLLFVVSGVVVPVPGLEMRRGVVVFDELASSFICTLIFSSHSDLFVGFDLCILCAPKLFYN
jgi:hypothetical protein